MLGAAVLMLAMPTGGPAAADGGTPEAALVQVGAIPSDPALGPFTPLAVDAHRRLLYGESLDPATKMHFVIYDIRTSTPRLVAAHVIGNYGTHAWDIYTNVIDTAHHRAYVRSGGTQIWVVDLDTGALATSFDLANTLPGFAPYGGAVGDGLLYFVGEINHTASEDGLLDKPAGPLPAVLAVHAGSGALAWWRPVPQCSQVLKGLNAGGALLARSRFEPALYFGCGSDLASRPEAGAVRLWLPAHPATATSADAAQTKAEIFPISGSYRTAGTTAVAAFDAASDRMFFQSLSVTTPGAYVFDGRLSSWDGQIAAPTDKWAGSPLFFGIDPSNDRYYMASAGPAGCTQNCGYVLSTTTDAFPVEQGVVQSNIEVGAMIVTDPATHRLFFPVGYAGPIAVYQDMAPKAAPPTPVDYDALTTGSPEQPSSYVTFGGSADGYGTEISVIGSSTAANVLNVDPGTQAGLAPGPRAIMAGRVSNTGLSGGGASAGAQALTPDATSLAQVEQTVDEVDPKWQFPYQALSCLDGGGGVLPATQSAPGGSATVGCDLAKKTATAKASYGEVSADQLDVGASGASTSVVRDATGAAATANANVQGISVSTPVGSLSIGAVKATATAHAHGARATATASWTRSVQGIVLRDPNGRVVYESPGCTSTVKAAQTHVQDSCEKVADAINSVFQNWGRVSFPLPSVVATPKGAFASAAQSNGDYAQERTLDDQGVTFTSDSVTQRATPALRLVLYADSEEPARTLAQFAAIEANAVYLINDFGTVSWPTPSPVPSSAPTLVAGGPATLPGPAPAQTSPTTTPTGVQAGSPASLHGTLLSVRSIGEALLLVSLWSLFALAALAVARRRRLLAAMGDSR